MGWAVGRLLERRVPFPGLSVLPRMVAGVRATTTSGLGYTLAAKSDGWVTVRIVFLAGLLTVGTGGSGRRGPLATSLRASQVFRCTTVTVHARLAVRGLSFFALPPTTASVTDALTFTVMVSSACTSVTGVPVIVNAVSLPAPGARASRPAGDADAVQVNFVMLAPAARVIVAVALWRMLCVAGAQVSVDVPRWTTLTEHLTFFTTFDPCLFVAVIANFRSYLTSRSGASTAVDENVWVVAEAFVSVAPPPGGVLDESVMVKPDGAVSATWVEVPCRIGVSAGEQPQPSASAGSAFSTGTRTSVDATTKAADHRFEFRRPAGAAVGVIRVPPLWAQVGPAPRQVCVAGRAFGVRDPGPRPCP